MGLHTTHEAWSGSYSMFNTWRTWVAAQIGIPLDLMQGHYSSEPPNNPFYFVDLAFPESERYKIGALKRLQEQLPLKWSAFKKTPLFVLLRHSDCDGYINWSDCGKIADALEDILSKVETDNQDSRSPETARGIYDGMYNATKRFINGCRLAHQNKERLQFR